MITSETKIRVRFNETDSMGYVYHGNYPAFYHTGRTELLRKLGISDFDLEKHGILLPVIEMQMKFIKPAFYDDVLTIKSTLKEFPKSRLNFHYKIFNQKNEHINEAYSTLVCVDSKTRKPLRIPQIIEEKLNVLANN